MQQQYQIFFGQAIKLYAKIIQFDSCFIKSHGKKKEICSLW